MCPCTQSVDTSLMTKAAVAPASMNWPGSTSFCTTVPAIGARIASSGRMATFWRSASDEILLA